MLSYKDSNGADIIFVDKLEDGKKEYLTLNNLIKKEGEPYKTVTVSNSSYSFYGSPHSVKSIKITKKDGSSVHIVENRIPMAGSIDSNGLDTFLHTLGNDVVMDFGGTLVRSMRSHGQQMVDHEGTEYTISTGEDTTSNELTNMLVAWMRRDNGRVVLPMIEKFLFICRMSRNDPNRLTGYVNMKRYMKMLNAPSTFSTSQSNQMIVSGKPEIIVENVNGSYLHVRISGITLVSKVNEPTPYSLFTARPMKVGTETLPFFTTRYKGITIFVSTVMLTNDAFIRSMHGGVDLLK